MTLTVRITVPADNGKYEAQVNQSNGNPAKILAPGDSVDITMHDANQITVVEVPAGTKDAQAQ